MDALSRQLAEQKQHLSLLGQDEQQEFERARKGIEECKRVQAEQQRDKTALNALIAKEEVAVVPRLPGIELFSDSLGQLLKEEHSTIWRRAHESWLGRLKAALEETESNIEKTARYLDHLKQLKVYQKGMSEMEGNSALMDIEQRLADEKNKLAEVNALSQQRKILQEETQRLIESIAERHFSFYNEANKFVSKIKWANDNLLIQGKVSVQTLALKEKLEGQITRKKQAQQRYIDSLVAHDTFNLKSIFAFLQKVLKREIAYNQYVDEQSLVSEFLSTNWFEINYDIVYQRDSFREMSPGKRAFVVLRLLLEFENSKCPILIDQPEDSLDNRAIFTELVQYLRVKKKERQIILVTHNPNVVVGADAEQVIVANQHGVHNENAGKIKFAYVSGSLENSSPKSTDSIPILESQGIREHVCEILEGGEDAFKKRENKYGFSS